MRNTILILAFVVAALGCKRQSEEFQFTVRGTIVGKESGQFFLYPHLLDIGGFRYGDEIPISFEDYSFTYSGTSTYMHSALIFLDYDMQSVFQIVIEPGEIVLELYWDSENLHEKSAVISGEYNKAMYDSKQRLRTLFENADVDSDETLYLFTRFFIENTNNFDIISTLNFWPSFDDDVMPLDKLTNALKNVKDKNLRNSKDFIELYSKWLALSDNINSVGSKAMNFKLPNKENLLIDFSAVSEGKLTYIEKSASWSDYATQNTRSLKPIYEKYKNNGLEIITIVPESQLERWQIWLQEEDFPWVNLVELQPTMVEHKLSYSDVLFFNSGNYLVDETGTVIGNNLSAETLNEILLERFEPEAYENYLVEKWEMPENVYILDQKQPITSFSELVEIMAGRPFLIDCWATWCGPCFYQFRYNDQLKAFLESISMEIVYISFDRPEDENQWIRAIRNNSLQGHHFRISNSFMNDLAVTGFKGALPTYMIVNENGEILESDAYLPSQQELLYDQIENLIRKNVP